MNVKSLFAGGLPGETYTQGVLRRGRSVAIVFAFALASVALAYCVFALSGSIWATLGAATLCGITFTKADLRLDPVRREAPKESDKLVWLGLFVPALALLGGAAIYIALHAQGGLDVFRAALLAGMFGWVLGFTALFFSADSRARVEE